MSTIRIIPPTENLVNEVVASLADCGSELEHVLVVFPGKRPSHVLRKALGLRRGSAFIPPLIASYDEFIQHLARRHLGLEERDVDMLDAASLLYEIHSGAERLGGEHFASFDQFLPLGFRLFDELEELMLADMDVKTIRQHVGGLAFGERHLLSRYFAEFYAGVRAQGRLTRSLRLVEVAGKADTMDFSGYKRIVVAGFYALTPVDRRLFRSLAGLEQSVMIFQDGPGLKDQLRWLSPERDTPVQMDFFGETPSAERPAHEPKLYFYKSTDTHGQIFALGAQLKALLDRGEPLDERTVVVLPSSEALFPVLYQALAILDDEGYNVSLGYPLARTPLYGLLANLLDLVGSAHGEAVQASAYTRFVLHPYVKNIRFGQRTDVTRVLFHAFEERLARRSRTIVDLKELESEHALFDRIARGLALKGDEFSSSDLKEHLRGIHDKMLRPFLEPGTLGEFGKKLTNLVLFINNESTAYRHPLFARYAEKLLDVADTISRSDSANRKFDEVTSYAAFLRGYIGPQAVPFPGTPLRGLQVLGLLETRALTFDRVFVLDASDEILPGARGTEMLLPRKVREVLGLETHRDREKLIEYYFNGLVNGAKEVHVFFSENSKHQRSRFIEKILWNRSQREKDRKSDEIGSVRYRIHLAQKDPPAIRKSEETKRWLEQFEFTTTALDVYLKCEIRFYYRYVLGLEEKEEVREEIEQLDVGNVVHTIMKSYFEPWAGKKLEAEELSTEGLEGIVEAVFQKTFGPNQNGAVYLLKQQTKSKLLEFLEDYQKRILEKETVELRGVEQELSVMKDRAHLSGRIDRIERRGDGKVYILDYKIRHDDTPYRVVWKKFDPEKRETWSDAIGSLQLPMYSLLYSEMTGEPVENIVPAYLFVGKNYLDPSIETGLSKDGVVTAEMQTNLHKVILALVREIRDADTPFRPAEDLKKQCPGCAYQVMCGTQWAREGRW